MVEYMGMPLEEAIELWEYAPPLAKVVTVGQIVFGGKHGIALAVGMAMAVALLGS